MAKHAYTQLEMLQIATGMPSFQLRPRVARFLNKQARLLWQPRICLHAALSAADRLPQPEPFPTPTNNWYTSTLPVALHGDRTLPATLSQPGQHVMSH